MRPLKRITLPRDQLHGRPASGLLMNVFGPYCAFSEEPLFDVAFIWDKKNNAEYPFQQEPEADWDSLLLLAPATYAAWARHHDVPRSQLIMPDEEITFSLADSPFTYSLEEIDIVYLDENGNADASPKRDYLVIVRGANERALATIDTFSLNTDYFHSDTNELRIPRDEYLSRVDARLHNRTEAWSRAVRAAELMADHKNDVPLLAQQVRMAAATTGFWSVWATVLWQRFSDRDLLSMVLASQRQESLTDRDIVGTGPHNDFPGTSPRWLRQGEGKVSAATDETLRYELKHLSLDQLNAEIDRVWRELSTNPEVRGEALEANISLEVLATVGRSQAITVMREGAGFGHTPIVIGFSPAVAKIAKDLWVKVILPRIGRRKGMDVVTPARTPKR